MKNIAIIGMGSRGLGVFERILTIYRSSSVASDLNIYLIDPGEYGQGVHSSEQPHYLLANTVACQVTMFCDRSVRDSGAPCEGPSFEDWARSEGYRNFNGQFCKSIGPLESSGIQANDYLPRALLGEYFTAVYDHLVKRVPKGIRLNRWKDKAVDIVPEADGALTLVLESGHQLSVDYVFLTTGHGHSRADAMDRDFTAFVKDSIASSPNLQFFRTSYPIRQLKGISPDAVVAVQGLGLSAHDVIAELTVGRGGRFIHQDGGLRYICSGREPRLLLVSRESIPFSGRAVNQKGTRGQYRGYFFTREAVHALRQNALRSRGSAQLDFETELWPLLLRDAMYVYRSTVDGYWQDPRLFEPTPEDEAAIHNILYPTKNRLFEDLGDFTQFVIEYLKCDIQQANDGNLDSPVKAATDVFRDLRNNLREAVNFAGLTPSSHKQFLGEYCPVIARVAIGPPKERNLQLLALLQAGVISWGGGHGATVHCDRAAHKFVIRTQFAGQLEERHADVLIKARVDGFSPSSDDSLLVHNLLRRGVIRPFFNGDYHPGGIDITTNQNPINSCGEVVRNVWALGNLAEGPNFYTHVLPQPHVNSSVIRDTAKCVLSMFMDFDAQAIAGEAMAFDVA